MRKWGVISGFSFILFFLTLPSFCQFLPEEIAERQKWEDFLSSANVVKSEQMIGPESVTSPWHLTLEKDGITNDALWKDVLGNEDRHLNNYFITEDWRMILPDHSRSFRTGGKWTKELLYTEKHKEGPMVMRELPRAFHEKIKSLDFEIIKGFVGEYLTDDEINAVLARKDLIIKEIEKLIQQNGEDKVLY